VPLDGRFAVDEENFRLLLKGIAQLTAAQREKLHQALSAPAQTSSVTSVIDGQPVEQVICPHCACEKVKLWGSANGLRRFRCTNCRRTFNSLTGTALARLRYKERWLDHTDALADTKTIRKTAEVLDVAVSTAFRWRHRFLAARRANKPGSMTGIVETDETYFRRSYKGSRQWSNPQEGEPEPPRKRRKRGKPTGHRGTPLAEQVPVLIIRDRQQTTGDAILPDTGAKTIAQHLIPLLGKDVVLCTDASKAYGVVAREAGIHHEPVNVANGERVRADVFHIQNVNAYDSRLKRWMTGFQGVATKYLASYLAWRRTLEAFGDAIQPAALLQSCHR